jgi:hypothetical protein
MNIRENFQSKLQQLREGTEQLDELSKGKLGDYVKKASHDVATKSAAVGRYADRANKARDKMKKGDYSDWQQGKKDDEFADKMFKKSWKRREGIAKATDKLTKEDYDPVAKKGADHADYVAKNLLKGEKKLKNKVTKLSDKFRKKAVTGMDEDYDSNERDAAKRAGTMHKFQSNYKSDDSQMNALAKKNSKYWKKQEVKHKKKAVTGLDEASDRVVTASKKSEKGTKWRLQSRDMDSDGSSMELRQGKRVKLRGAFDRHAQDFNMSPTKKGKIDWKAKSKYYDDPKDIMKTVKEEHLDELSRKTLNS